MSLKYYNRLQKFTHRKSEDKIKRFVPSQKSTYNGVLSCLLRPAALIKEGLHFWYFLCILRNFTKQFFCTIRVNDYFWLDPNFINAFGLGTNKQTENLASKNLLCRMCSKAPAKGPKYIQLSLLISFFLTWKK